MAYFSSIEVYAMQEKPFLKMIKTLRETEELILYSNAIDLNDDESKQIAVFLENEFKIESLNWPQNNWTYDQNAALWAAKLIYKAAHLLLNREQNSQEVQDELPLYAIGISSSVVLSADLCLRFLPDIIKELRLIDPEDILIEKLHKQLLHWPYSAMPCEDIEPKVSYVFLPNDTILKQLFVDKVLDNKCYKWTQIDEVKENIRMHLGDYPKQLLQSEYDLVFTNDETN